MAASEERLQFRIDAGTAEWLASRAKRMPLASLDRRSTEASVINTQARTELALWRLALKAELGRIRLTLGQALCLADVLNGHIVEASVASGVGLAFTECYDAFRLARGGPAPDVSSYGAKHGPEGCDPAEWERALADYLGTLGPVADYALRDAIARWWEEVSQDAELADTAEGFGVVGLPIVG
jgi:hypothetical protein